MRISDWSSDVCSSDLCPAARRAADDELSARNRHADSRTMARASERISGARARPDIPLCRLRRADEETLPLPGLMGHRTRAMTIYCDESGGLNAGAMPFAAGMLTPEVAAAIHARYRAVTGLRGELKGSRNSLTEQAYLDRKSVVWGKRVPVR